MGVSEPLAWCEGEDFCFPSLGKQVSKERNRSLLKEQDESCGYKHIPAENRDLSCLYRSPQRLSVPLTGKMPLLQPHSGV